VTPNVQPAPRPSLGFRLLQRFLRAFFRAFYLLEVKGLENIPNGPVVLAANHVNPFDAIILGAVAPRRVRFVVWNRTFDKPAFRWIMTAVGCIPINRDRPDTTAFKESLRWLATGNILGIFPEGRYTETGHLHELKPGTMRIAMAAGAAVVPATITGAYRAWPLRGANAKAFPRPWKIQLKFHPPIFPGDDRAAAEALTRQLADAINSTLEPAVRAEAKVDRLIAQPASHLRLYEWFLCVVLVALRQPILAGLYFAYLLVDIYAIRQSALPRFLRNFSPALVLVVAYPLMLPLEWWHAAVFAYVLWTMIQLCYKKYLPFQRYVRGLLLATYAGLFLPHPGLTVMLAVYTLAFQRWWLAALAIGSWALGYSPTWLALNALIVAVIFVYMHLFKFRAHDGRRI
jgi:1-acyl-sn-glycerol-3-phosphate acyltransferase